MNITNTPHIQTTHNIQGLQRTAAGRGTADAAGSSAALQDSVSFSDEALRLGGMTPANTESARIRFDLVNRVRAEIAAGTYDTPERMDIALERMANRVF